MPSRESPPRGSPRERGHQGDSADQKGPVWAPGTLGALRKFADGGGGLYLSGAAFSMIHKMGVERARPRLGPPGNDRSRAAMAPAVSKHPIFRGLAFSGGTVNLSDRGHPAYSDFHGSGGPASGMLLAKAGGGSENPLVEYAVGKGRAIVMGWRLPHYSNATNAHRANLERITANILGYLAQPKSWQKVVVGGAPPTVKTAIKVDFEPVRLAARHLKATFGRRYPRGDEFLARIDRLEAEHKELAGEGGGDKKKLAELRREALLANPLVDFDKMLVVKRSASSPKLGLVSNWQSNACLPRKGYDDEIATLSGFKGATEDAAELATLYKPEGRVFVGDVDLHWDADRMLFSMPGANGRWQVHEMRADGSGLRELPLIGESDVDNYDACYLPDGRVLFTSTAPFVGVPCVKGGSHVSNIYIFDEKAESIRRLTFEQDHDWCPTVMPNGRVLYLRWEYTDIPHFVSRILFHMNPDGTEQMAYYGSNSYWPNAMFYARPCPGSSSRFAAIVGGHHDVARMGELVVFDVAKGRREADGVVQRITQRGKKVEPVILDGLVRGSWPKFLHPWPLSDSYFIVSAKPTSKSAWGVYLVDVFDNMVLLKEDPGYALLEPLPLKRTPRPPVVPDRVNPAKKDAIVSIKDIYTGDGLKGVPRGAVKRLRLVSYHFAYHGMGGQINRVGLDGPWDVRRIIGTVPVEPDGSACFRVPANTPIALQPLDSEGKALQLMRSWMTAMPGEVLSCVGCHEGQNAAPPRRRAMALAKAPAEIEPWYGPARGFSFKREVQPVLDHHCVRCHDGGAREDGKTLPDFTTRPEVNAACKSGAYVKGTKFSPSYIALRGYIRGHTIESDIHMLNPGEFHADTTRLVRHLKKGHSGVRLDAEAWDRIVTWIDLNTPYHGTWHEIVGMKKVERQRDRRRAMDSRYAGLDGDSEEVFESRYAPAAAGRTPAPKPEDAVAASPACPGWPFSADEARRRQSASGPASKSVDLGGGVKLELVRVPAGEFVMGDPAGGADERPLARARGEGVLDGQVRDH